MIRSARSILSAAVPAAALLGAALLGAACASTPGSTSIPSIDLPSQNDQSWKIVSRPAPGPITPEREEGEPR